MDTWSAAKAESHKNARKKVVAQKRCGKPRKSWDEVLLDDRKKLGMDNADPQNRSEWRGRLRRRLVKQVQPSVDLPLMLQIL